MQWSVEDNVVLKSRRSFPQLREIVKVFCTDVSAKIIKSYNCGRQGTTKSPDVR